MKHLLRSYLLTLFLLLVALAPASIVCAQTSSFTYQGRFIDSGTAANGTYEMQFRLFTNVSGGNQIGSTITNTAVNVSNGVFTVQLDYGAAAFSGADRYLEIGVRPAGDSNPHTILAPRQQLTSAVYAIRAGSATNSDNATVATNATQLGGVNANQYVLTGDARLTDARTPTAGSSNYIQNSLNQQAANFNISGNGTAGGTVSANSVNATTGYKIGGLDAFKITGTGSVAPNSNTFVGVGAGNSTVPLSTDGFSNSFFGFNAGVANTKGYGNSFFGTGAGDSNTIGAVNTFFGRGAGSNNISGNDNAFFGESSGLNSNGFSNAFFGANSGLHITTGDRNTFIGNSAGISNETGSRNTAIGADADIDGTNLTNATAIGTRARVTQSNSLVLGAIKGIGFGSNADTNVGIGTTAPQYRLTVRTDTNSYGFVHTDGNIELGTVMNGSAGAWFGTRSNHALTFFVNDGIAPLQIGNTGFVHLNILGSAGSTQLCRNASNIISTCSSSLRYKKDVHAFTRGLSLLNNLKPISFNWKSDNTPDLGFGAEDVAAVEPLLVTRNEKGEVEGVKYDRITAVLVNAVKEQQELMRQQQTEIASLKRLVCRQNRRASACKR